MAAIKQYIPRSGSSTRVEAVFYERPADIREIKILLPYSDIDFFGKDLIIDEVKVPEQSWVVQPPFGYNRIYSEEKFKSLFEPWEVKMNLF